MAAVAPELEPFMDLVQIRTKDQFGTGLLVAPGIVLTARHCVADPRRGWATRQRIAVCLWRELAGAGLPQAENEIPAELVWPRPDEAGPEDIAVLLLKPSPEPYRRWQYRRLGAEERRTQARGFPAAAAGPALAGGRIEVNLPGAASIKNQRSLSFVSNAGLANPARNDWRGLSGGPLILDGELVGVMREVDERWDPTKVLEAEPFALAFEQAQNHNLRRLLPLKPAEAAAPPGPPPSPSRSFSLLLDVLYTLDRTDEVDEALLGLAEHEGRRPVELLVIGEPADLGQHFWQRLWLEKLGRTPGGASPARHPDQPPDLLPGVAPLAIDWPRTGGNPATAARILARRALDLVQPGEKLPASLRDPLRAVLEQAGRPAFLCLNLPDDPAPSDRALLDEWRAVWSGLPIAPAANAGYVLLYSGALPLPALYHPNPAQQHTLASIRVDLQPVRAGDVAKWQYLLDKLWEQGGRTGPRLTELAIALSDMLQGRPHLRLRDIQTVMAGGWDRRAA